MIELLNSLRVTYVRIRFFPSHDSFLVVQGYFDILNDETVRSGLKLYSNWPTYPQLYISGDFAGLLLYPI